MSSYPSSFPPPITADQEIRLVSEIKQWCINHSLAIKSSEAVYAVDRENVTNAPVTLFPSPFPKSCFEHAIALQKIYNELYAAISDDVDWLDEVLGKYVMDALGDESIHFLFDQSPEESLSLKQVEFNTISSSFGVLSSKVTDLHAHLLNKAGQGTTDIYPAHPLLDPSTTQLPDNGAILNLVSGLYMAHKAYNISRSVPPLPLCILFVVQPNERNVFDQYAISSKLKTDYRIAVFRLEVPDILKHTSIPDVTANTERPLVYTPPKSPQTPYEVSTIYFRALYSPDEYTSNSASSPFTDATSTWSARLHLEQSCAIKCPTVLLQLAGCKKVQQVLADPDPDKSTHLFHRFLPTTPPSTLSSLASTFAPQYDLSSTGGGLDLALDDSTARNHVLKPQREGGGNNIYRSAIPAFVAAMSPPEERDRWVLMELIRTPDVAQNRILRSDGEVFSGDVISELGIFGTILWRKKRWYEKNATPAAGGGGGADGSTADNSHGDQRGIVVLRNEEGGYLLRTKARSSDEGGVAAGFGALDSVRLYEEGWEEEARVRELEKESARKSGGYVEKGKGEEDAEEERAGKRAKLDVEE
ncbi:MAG: hypothetical protein Q9160_008581 [Pyrenula sp. 1 TL-2023]